MTHWAEGAAGTGRYEAKLGVERLCRSAVRGTGNRTCKNLALVCPRGAQSRNMCIDRRLRRGYNMIVPGRARRRTPGAKGGLRGLDLFIESLGNKLDKTARCPRLRFYAAARDSPSFVFNADLSPISHQH